MTAGLNDDRALPHLDKMRHLRGNEDEAARRIGLQLCLIEGLSKPEVPGALHNRDAFVVGVRMREDARTARDSCSVDPIAALARIAVELRSLSAVGVVGRREPPH